MFGGTLVERLERHLGCRHAVVGDDDYRDGPVQLDVVEPVAGDLTDPVDPLRRLLDGACPTASSFRRRWYSVTADDVGMLGRQGQHLGAATADGDRRARPRRGRGCLESLDLVELAVEIDRLARASGRRGSSAPRRAGGCGLPGSRTGYPPCRTRPSSNLRRCPSSRRPSTGHRWWWPPWQGSPGGEAVGQDRRAQADGARRLAQRAEGRKRPDLVAEVVKSQSKLEAVLFCGLGELDELARAALPYFATGSESELRGSSTTPVSTIRNSTDTVRGPGANRPNARE